MSPFMYSIKKNISNNYTTKVDEKREEIDLYLISDQEHCICEKFFYFAKKGTKCCRHEHTDLYNNMSTSDFQFRVSLYIMIYNNKKSRK